MRLSLELLKLSGAFDQRKVAPLGKNDICSRKNSKIFSINMPRTL
jgi:hypothetical protein